MTDRTDAGTPSPTTPRGSAGATRATAGATARERRPWTPLELGLLLSLVYLLLLISLAGARIARPQPPDRTTAAPTRLVAATAPAPGAAAAATAPAAPAASGAPDAATPAGANAGEPGGAEADAAAGSASGSAAGSAAGSAGSTCVGPGTRPRSYAGEPGVEAPLAFGPPVTGAVETVNGTLIQRLCGIPQPGQPARAPDRRLFVALDAVVNGRDPNRAIPRAEWAAGVDAFITRDAQWTRARIVTRAAPAGTRTYGMRVRAGQDPLVEPTRLRNATRSSYLVLPVSRAGGGETVLTLRLACGFQPTFPPA